METIGRVEGLGLHGSGSRLQGFRVRKFGFRVEGLVPKKCRARNRLGFWGILYF